MCFTSTYIQCIHVCVVLPLPVLGKSGEDGVLCDLTSKLVIQPVSQQVLSGLQELLSKHSYKVTNFITTNEQQNNDNNNEIYIYWKM